MSPAVEIATVDDALGAQIHDEIAFAFIGNHTDRIGTGGVDQLDRIGAQAPRRAPDQHVLARLEVMRLVTEQHPVGGGQRQRVAGAFFPRQVLGARHELLGLHIGELREGAVRGFIAPDPLGRRIHRVAAVAFLVVTIVLVAVDHHLVADLPALHLVAHRPDDARGIGSGNVVGGLVAIKGADRRAQRGPDSVVIHARRHHQNQHFVAVQHRHIYDFQLHGRVRLAVAFLADGPCVHLFGHISHGRDLTHFIEVFFRCLIGRNVGLGVQSHGGLLVSTGLAATQNRGATGGDMGQRATLQ